MMIRVSQIEIPWIGSWDQERATYNKGKERKGLEERSVGIVEAKILFTFSCPGQFSSQVGSFDVVTPFSFPV